MQCCLMPPNFFFNFSFCFFFHPPSYPLLLDPRFIIGIVLKMFYWELTKASWPGSENAWDKTRLAEHSRK